MKGKGKAKATSSSAGTSRRASIRKQPLPPTNKCKSGDGQGRTEFTVQAVIIITCGIEKTVSIMEVTLL